MSGLAIVLRRTGIICALVCWFGSTVAAEPIRFTSNRLVEGRAAAETAEHGSFATTAFDTTPLLGLVNMGVSGSTPPPEFELPTLASFSATQQTNVSATGWSGSGTVQTETILGGELNYGSATAESAMFIEFTLAEPMSYGFTSTLRDFSSAYLTGPTGLAWVFTNDSAVPLVAMRRGLLSPGEYFFHATAYSISDSFGRRKATSGFDLQFTLSDPVPEPATILLFGTGAAFMVRAAWRRRREQLVRASGR